MAERTKKAKPVDKAETVVKVEEVKQTKTESTDLDTTVEEVEETFEEKLEKKAAKKAAKKANKLKLKEREDRITSKAPKTHTSKKTKKEPKVKFNEAEEGKVWFRKVGRGSLRKVPGCPPIIKPNEKFLAHPEDIPTAFLNSIVRVDNEKITKEGMIQSVDMVYKVKKLTTGLCNVVNKKGKKMNPKPLDQEAAIKLRNQLND